jgi:polyhydroxyalkanoate synthesis regulator phasin
MATRSGGSKSTSSRKRTTAKTKAKAKPKPKARKAPSSRASGSRGSASRSSAGRSDKSVQAFRDALERSRSALESNVTMPRERVQEVVDDAVKRGRMTRGDANELVSNLVSRSRKATDDLIRDLEKLLEQARKEVEARTTKARKELDKRGSKTRKQATRAAERVGRVARDAADRPLAEADKLRRRAGAPGPAISGYEQLTAAQVKTRLKDLSKGDLRMVRTQEKNGKARKGILDAIDKQLAK